MKVSLWQRYIFQVHVLWIALSPVERNSLGTDRIIVYRYNRLYPIFKMLYENKDSEQQVNWIFSISIFTPFVYFSHLPPTPTHQSLEINPEFANGMRGSLSIDSRMTRVCKSGGLVESPVPSLHDIKKSYAIWYIHLLTVIHVHVYRCIYKLQTSCVVLQVCFVPIFAKVIHFYCWLNS